MVISWVRLQKLCKWMFFILYFFFISAHFIFLHNANLKNSLHWQENNCGEGILFKNSDYKENQFQTLFFSVTKGHKLLFGQ